MKSSPSFVAIGLAFFSMFFGAGNLMFAINIGRLNQSQTPYALLGFAVTAVFLPAVGILSILLRNGIQSDYFGLIGRRAGFALSFFCFLIIGPCVAMPRIITLSHTMLEPYMFDLPLWAYACFFSLITYAISVRENLILKILSYIISPLLLASLAVMVLGAIFKAPQIETLSYPMGPLILQNIGYGFNTLDFLTSIYFATIIVSILRKSLPKGAALKPSEMTRLGFYGGLVGVGLLGVVYCGLAYLGAAFGASADSVNEGEAFRQIVQTLLGPIGGLVLGVAILLACLSTMIALAALSGEYFEKEIFRNKIRYEAGLLISFVIAISFSIFGLTNIIEYAKPIVAIVHPFIVVLAVLNILAMKYKLKHAKPIAWVCFVPILAWQISEYLGLY